MIYWLYKYFVIYSKALLSQAKTFLGKKHIQDNVEMDE